MLISCPKCHSIYEIPDNLIGKTGKRFRCHTCETIWHAMPEDALDFNDEEEEPYIEAISVAVPPYRHYPADKEKYTIPSDTKSGRRTRSSKEIIEDETDLEDLPPLPSRHKKKEITLTSDQGTSFTISAIPEYEEYNADKKAPHFFDQTETGIHANKDERLLPEAPFKGYKKCTLLILLLLILSACLFLRREFVAFYPQTETWYNKIHLTGLYNPQYLKFENISMVKENNNTLKISGEIINNARYGTYIPEITLGNRKETFLADRKFVKAGEKAFFEIGIPFPETTDSMNITLGFKQP